MIWLFAGLVFIGPLTAYALMKWFDKKQSDLPVLVSNEHRVHDFYLLNQDSQLVSQVSWKDKIIVADFFFTFCTTICPKMTASLVKVQKVYRNDPVIRFNSFTVDPERDGPSQLKNYAAALGISTTNWDLLTGPKHEVYKLARNGFKVVATDGDGGPDDFIHSSRLVLVDKQKRIRGYYDGTDAGEVERLIEDIRKLKKD